MNFDPKTVKESYAAARQACRSAGSTFVGSFAFLGGDQRRAMEAIYAFMRHTDDLADDRPSEAGESADDSWNPRAALKRWRKTLDAALANRQLSPAKIGSLLVGGSIDEVAGMAILPALADAIARFRIPHQLFFDVIDGVELDLAKNRYQTFAELEHYCHLVASAVGMACIHVWGFSGPEAFEPARHCGVAMQLTNILRDLAEDFARNRVYLPAEDLASHGYSEGDLAAGCADSRFDKLMAFEIARAEEYYRRAEPLLDMLEDSSPRVFGMMLSHYRLLLRKIARQPGEVFRRRVRLGAVRKLALAARWAILPPRF